MRTHRLGFSLFPLSPISSLSTNCGSKSSSWDVVVLFLSVFVLHWRRFNFLFLWSSNLGSQSSFSFCNWLPRVTTGSKKKIIFLWSAGFPFLSLYLKEDHLCDGRIILFFLMAITWSSIKRKEGSWMRIPWLHLLFLKSSYNFGAMCYFLYYEDPKVRALIKKNEDVKPRPGHKPSSFLIF